MVYKDNEDGHLTFAFKGMNKDEYTPLRTKDVLIQIEDSKFWNDVDEKVWKYVSDDLDVDYDAFDDPDFLFDAMIEAYRQHMVEKVECATAEEHPTWYAVEYNYDNDAGNGSTDIEDAVDIAINKRADYIRLFYDGTDECYASVYMD